MYNTMALIVLRRVEPYPMDAIHLHDRVIRSHDAAHDEACLPRVDCDVRTDIQYILFSNRPIQ